MYLTNFTEPARLPGNLPSNLPHQLIQSIESSLNLFCFTYAPKLTRPDNQEVMKTQRQKYESKQASGPVIKIKRPGDGDDPNIFAVGICESRSPDFYQCYIFVIQSGVGRVYYKFYFMVGHDLEQKNALVTLSGVKRFGRDGSEPEMIYTANVEDAINDGFIIPMN